MELSPNEIAKEEKYLEDVTKIIREKVSNLGSELSGREEKALEFKKFIWDNRTEMDPDELKTMVSNNNLEMQLMGMKGEYLLKLFKIQNNPYFGRINFKTKDEENDVYIGITHVDKDDKYYVHDWRSPICNLFYDYEVGPAEYKVEDDTIKGEVTLKRQYTIKNGKLKHVFDNNINIDDELLQEVLANESNDKMKNIVNTIQAEQNKVIRNTDDKNLVVQGIAGSGKTSVALHRIAFLLYKIEGLNSNNVLIFSPNDVFSEYISNVLPELGESNTIQTTINDFLTSEIKEFKEVESFTSFIERSYREKSNFDFIKYKQSDEVYDDIDKYIEFVENNIKVKEDLITKYYSYTKEELNYLFHERYKKFPIVERLKVISEKLSERNFNGKIGHAKTIAKEIRERMNYNFNLIETYIHFYKSKYSKFHEDLSYLSKNKKKLNYDDACLFAYMRCKLLGYDYNTNIKQIVIDEAQDYSFGQMKLITRIFKNASYTILGDVNQTINPYYKYESLEKLCEILPYSKYLELNKTYRSSSEIVEYSNKVLGLNLVTAIRRGEEVPVDEKEETNLLDNLKEDLSKLKNYGKSIAIITKNDTECENISDLLKDTGITKINNTSKEFNRKLVVVPVYMAKGLEFDSVIIYTDKLNKYTKDEKYLLYVAITRAQHKLIVYNQNN